jgi:hypothetical protein
MSGLFGEIKATKHRINTGIKKRGKVYVPPSSSYPTPKSVSSSSFILSNPPPPAPPPTAVGAEVEEGYLVPISIRPARLGPGIIWRPVPSPGPGLDAEEEAGREEEETREGSADVIRCCCCASVVVLVLVVGACELETDLAETPCKRGESPDGRCVLSCCCCCCCCCCVGCGWGMDWGLSTSAPSSLSSRCAPEVEVEVGLTFNFRFVPLSPEPTADAGPADKAGPETTR